MVWMVVVGMKRMVCVVGWWLEWWELVGWWLEWCDEMDGVCGNEGNDVCGGVVVGMVCMVGWWLEWCVWQV